MTNSIIRNMTVSVTLVNVGVEVVISSPNIAMVALIKLFTVCHAELTSIPFVFKVKIPKMSPDTNTSINPKLLYPCVSVKSIVWIINARIGMLNHDPKVCIISPRNIYSSAMH